METGEEEGIIVVEVEEARPELDEAAVKMVKVVDKAKIKERSIAQSLIPRQIKCAAAITLTVTKLGSVLHPSHAPSSTSALRDNEGQTSLTIELTRNKLIMTRFFRALIR